MIQHATKQIAAHPPAADPTLSGLRLDVVRQLLGDLDTVTAAGRSFTMGKVVGLLRQEIGVAELGLSELRRRVIKNALDDLMREQRRLLPDADAFVTRSQMITDTLALV